MTVRVLDDPSATSLLSLTTGAGLTLVTQTFSPGPPLPSAPNGIQIVITKAQSLAMNGGVPQLGGYYDVFLDQPSGTSLLLMAGAFDLAATVTR